LNVILDGVDEPDAPRSEPINSRSLESLNDARTSRSGPDGGFVHILGTRCL